MSSHTDEEIRAAFLKLYPIEKSADDLIAELNRLAIHDNVPVLYHYNGADRLSLSRTAFADEVTNIRPLIPVETAREIARRVIKLHCTQYDHLNAARLEVDRDFAHYTQHGPEDTP